MNALVAEITGTPEFRRNPAQARKSGLDRIAQSPAHYIHWCREEDQDTPALRFGRMFHCFVFEQSKFSERYVVAPAFGDLRTSAGKARKAEFLETAGKREMVTAEDYETALRMVDSIVAHPTARNLIIAGQAEREIRWTDPETGLDCGGRLDFHIPELRIAVDLKTTDNASPGTFARSVALHRYHVQDCHYRDGMRLIGEPIEHFLFLAIEKTAPYGVSVCYVDDAAMERGEALRRRDMATLKRCLETNEWPCYSTDLVPVSLPAWAYYDN